jgi:hypothetical protein
MMVEILLESSTFRLRILLVRRSGCVSIGRCSNLRGCVGFGSCFFVGFVGSSGFFLMLLRRNHSTDGYLQVFDVGIVAGNVLVKASKQTLEQAGVVFQRIDQEPTKFVGASEVVT